MEYDPERNERKENKGKENKGKENKGKENKGKENKEDEREADDDLYLRYYCGNKGEFGYEFVEFEFRPNGKFRYANTSNYKTETLIRKQLCVNKTVMKEVQRIIEYSDIMEKNDYLWPKSNAVGKQELEIIFGNEHKSFSTAKIDSENDIENSKDPAGLETLYCIVQDLKNLVYSLTNELPIRPI